MKTIKQFGDRLPHTLGHIPWNRYHENKKQFLEFVYNKYNIDDDIFNNDDGFDSLMREIKIDDILNESNSKNTKQ